MEVAKRAGVTHRASISHRYDGRMKTNVHYPTDSSLLQDGVRVLTRTMHRKRALSDGRRRVRDRRRSAAVDVYGHRTPGAMADARRPHPQLSAPD